MVPPKPKASEGPTRLQGHEGVLKVTLSLERSGRDVALPQRLCGTWPWAWKYLSRHFTRHMEIQTLGPSKALIA